MNQEKIDKIKEKRNEHNLKKEEIRTELIEDIKNKEIERIYKKEEIKEEIKEKHQEIKVKKEEIKHHIKEIEYLKKVNVINNTTIGLNIGILIYKIGSLIGYQDTFLIPSIIYSIFIILAKGVFFIGYKKNLTEDEELKYFLFYGIFLFLGSLSYLIYWIIEYVINPVSIHLGLAKFIVYLIVYLVEIFSSIEGLFESNKKHDLLLKGLKFIDLSIALSALMMVIIIIFGYFIGENNKYIINIFGIIISFIIFILYFKYKRKSNK